MQWSQSLLFNKNYSYAAVSFYERL